MRIFLAGATGVMGRHLLPLLLADGHVLAGMTRSAAKASRLKALGVLPVVCNVFDQELLATAVKAFHPDLVMHQLTDLPDDPGQLAASMAANNRIRRKGTAHLLAAAAAAGVHRILVQSVAWELPGDGGAAVADLEDQARAAGGVIVRYGRLYGPGTYYQTSPPDPPRVHVLDAARATIALLAAPPGVYPVVEQAAFPERQ